MLPCLCLQGTQCSEGLGSSQSSSISQALPSCSLPMTLPGTPRMCASRSTAKTAHHWNTGEQSSDVLAMCDVRSLTLAAVSQT